MYYKVFDALCRAKIYVNKRVTKEKYLDTPEEFRSYNNSYNGQYIFEGPMDNDEIKLLLLAKQTHYLSTIKNIVVTSFIIGCVAAIAGFFSMVKIWL